MRAVKHRSDTVQIDAHARTPPLGYLTAQSNNQFLNIPPRDIRSLGLLDNPVEGPLEFPVDAACIVS